MRTSLFCLASALALVGCETPRSVFEREVAESFRREKSFAENKLVAESDIAHLPIPVRRYLRFAGVVGKPRIQTVRLRQSGLFKTSLSSGWKPLVAEEYYFPNQRSFFWLGDVQFFSFLSAYARDKYDHNGVGNVWVKLGNIITVGNLRGVEADVSSLIRYLNELVWFPSAFLDPVITWTPIDDMKATATISVHGISTSATLHFNSLGEMILFESVERYANIDGKMEKAPWRTPMRNYKEFDGYKIPTEGEAIYELKTGDFEYGRLVIDHMQVNKMDMYPSH